MSNVDENPTELRESLRVAPATLESLGLERLTGLPQGPLREELDPRRRHDANPDRYSTRIEATEQDRLAPSPPNRADGSTAEDAMPSNPSSARCCSVRSEHGSTPSMRRSRGRGGNDNPVGWVGAGCGDASPEHPTTSSIATSSPIPRIRPTVAALSTHTPRRTHRCTSRTKPSCTAVATNAPSRVVKCPVASPREPEALGE